jgi:hypothetical protein
MSKRDTGTKHTNDGTITPNASGASTANALEQRVVAFAEQLGRIAGTVQAKAEGWMDRHPIQFVADPRLTKHRGDLRLLKIRTVCQREPHHSTRFNRLLRVAETA